MRIRLTMVVLACALSACGPMTVADAGVGGGGGTTGGGTTGGGTTGGGATGGGTTGGGTTGGGTTGGGTTGGGTTGGGSATGGGGGTTGGGGGTTGGGGGTVMPTQQALLSLSAGTDFTCAVLANKTVKCWGAGGSGRLGNGANMEQSRPVAVMGLTTAAKVTTGYHHACALLDDSSVRCWGNNDYGQLGNGITGTNSNVPVTVMNLTGVKSIHAGVNSTCALLNAGTVSCWGKGIELGDATLLTHSNVPRAVPNLSNVAQLSVANTPGNMEAHVCGVRNDATAFCWGSGLEGQLGQSDNSSIRYNDARAPVPVFGITDAIEITAGGLHGCARRTSGLSCWGFGAQVGNGATDRVTTPATVTANGTITQFEAGGDFTIALTSTGTLLSWGYNGRGQCGDGRTTFPPSSPIITSPTPAVIMNATMIAAGDAHACAYLSSTQVTWCWGDNISSALGFDIAGTETRTAVPDFVRW